MNSEKGKLRHQNREIKAIFGTRDLLFSFNGTIKEQAPPFNVSVQFPVCGDQLPLVCRARRASTLSRDEERDITRLS